jgi:hypothetical protein
MANLFDATNAPEGEPLEIVPGDYLIWKKTAIAQDYPPASYTATYVARITGGGSSEVQVTGTSGGGGAYYLFTVSSATSAGFNPGVYHWQLEIVQNSTSNRIVVERGEFTALADLDINGADPRSHAQIMVGKIESILAGKADSDVSNYSIAGRSLTKMTFAELMDARDRYKAEYQREVIKDRVRRGKSSGATVKVRF